MKFKFLSILVIMSTFFTTYSTSYAHPEEELIINSEAAILINAKSGQILFHKNASRQMYPASITKMITGIVAIEQGDLADSVSVSKEATEVDGTTVYLLEDEKVELDRLVKGLLINSGNDAGIAIAEHFAGSERNFATMMNDFVMSKVGVHNTNFTNPHGLFDWDHYTTAYDMAKIAQYAMKNDIFKEIVGTRELEWKGEGWETTLINHHRLLGNFKGVTGIKNGYVSKSGFTLVTSAQRDGVELIAVTLNAPSSQKGYADTVALLNDGFQKYTRKYLVYKGLLSSSITSDIDKNILTNTYSGVSYLRWPFHIDSYSKIKDLIEQSLAKDQPETPND